MYRENSGRPSTEPLGTQYFKGGKSDLDVLHKPTAVDLTDVKR